MNMSYIDKCKTLEKKFSQYKLWGNLVPEKTFNINLRKVLSKEEWEILRKAVYKKANYECYICGASTPNLEIHKEWLYDYNSSIQQLNEINALCDLCYLNKHPDRKHDKAKSILHWSLVNNEAYNNFEKYEKLVRELRDLRNNFDWKVIDHLGNDITKGVKLYDLLKLVAKDYKGEYLPNSQNKEIHFKSLEDICDQFEKNISELKEIRIYKWNKDCWKCYKETPHVSYCLVFQGVVLGCIGDIEKLDEILLKEYLFVKRVYSKTQGRRVIGNTCVHCGAYQGNFFIFDEIIHYVDEENLDKTIPNILNDDDVPLIISMLDEFEDNDEIDYTCLNDIDFLYDLGIDYMYRRSYEYAIKIFEKILQIEPKDSDALAYIGKIYAERLEYDKAIETYNAVLKIDPEDSMISELDILLLEMEKEFSLNLYEISESIRFEGVLVLEKKNIIYDIRIGEGSGYYQVREECNNIILSKDKEFFEIFSNVLARNNYQIDNYGTLYGEADFSINLSGEEVIDDRVIVMHFKDCYAEINAYDTIELNNPK